MSVIKKRKQKHYGTNVRKRSTAAAKSDNTGNNRKSVSRTSVRGILQKTMRGFGFVTPENGGSDIYISGYNMNGAMNGDEVEVSLYPDSRRTGSFEGRIDGIITRAVTEIVGSFERNRQFGYVIPDDRKIQEDIFIARKDFGTADKGDKVLVKITKYPEKNGGAEGKITEVISRAGEAGGDIKALVRAFNLTSDFPVSVLSEARKFEKEVSGQDAAIGDCVPKRIDLRNDKIFTIDGADSRDFDDAVSISLTDDGHYLLGVHIADVTHYVKEESPLDKEALQRGTSVYLPDFVIPMLPEDLSNGICSLNPDVDRLTLSIQMEIDRKGRVISHEIFESVIRSCFRLVYDDISDLLENDDERQKAKYADILEELFLMKELAEMLERTSDERGSIDFDLDEAVIQLDDEGLPTEISTADRRIANRLIEQFMILANETVAEQFFFLKTPFVYRVHERPEEEKMNEFRTFISEFGLKLRGNTAAIRPAALNGLLHDIIGNPEERVIKTVMLRSMKKAVYDTECLGHFGLALRYYCHFTSPIRRYPDLIIHRIIKERLGGQLSKSRERHLKQKAEYAAAQSSEREKNALELEREVEKLMKAEYMSYHIGEEHEALISGVTSFGLFAQLKNTVEGLIRMDDLNDDYYDFEREKYRLIGRRTGKIYCLGDTVHIRVSSVNTENREINFTLCDSVSKIQG